MERKNVKEQVLTILHEHKGTYYSGQELAESIGVTRTSVWKAINHLRDEGYQIVGSTKLGYTMAEDTDILSAYEVEKFLSKEAKSFYHLTCLDETDSTNERCKDLGSEGLPEGQCVIALKQTAGKGRRGRSFYSPEGTGLYLSILLRPQLAFEDSVLITTATAVAAASACEKTNPNLKDGDIRIKWVNDLFLNGKKISGMLTEAILSMETAGLDYAVLGIGFNLKTPKGGWPEEIDSVAASLFKEEEYIAGSRNKLAAEFLNAFLPIYQALPDVTYLSEYRRRQLTVGKKIWVIEADGSKRKAEALDVNDRCQLIVRYEGEQDTVELNSGEISTREA